MAPILIFIGLEITAQGFLASPPRHGPAVAIGFIPVVAALVTIQAGRPPGRGGEDRRRSVGRGGGELR